MISFSEANGAWMRAIAPTLTIHALDRRELTELVNWLRTGLTLTLDLGDGAKPAHALIWEIRKAVSTTLLPFSSEHLELRSRAASLRSILAVAKFRPWLDQLDCLIDALPNANPKKDALDEIWIACEPMPIVLWNKPRNQLPLGWPDAAMDLLLEYGGNVEVAAGLRSLPIGDHVLVLMSPLDERICDAAFALRLFGRGRARTTHILRYGFEPLGDMHFPLNQSGDALLVAGEARSITSESHDSETPAWAGDVSLTEVEEFLRNDIGLEEEGPSDPEPAMLVRLAPAGFVYFARSALIPLANGSREDRVPASDLAPGDWIPVQEAGEDSHEFIEKADAILNKRGRSRAELERNLGEWKTKLRTCLARNGALAIAKKMAAIGGLDVGTGRIEAWAGSRVMAPGEKRTFHALLKAIHQLGFLQDAPDIDAYASDRWKAVSLLRDANRQGGRQVSEELSELLTEMLAERQLALGDTLSLSDDGRRFQVVEVEQIMDAGLVPRHLFGRIRGNS